MTQLTDPWAPTPMVVPDFIWYGAGGTLFASLSYVVNGITYPPAIDVFYTGDHVRYSAYTTPIGQTVFFDAINSVALSGVPQTIIPTGVTVVSYQWDFGNGKTASGSVASTTYLTASPDVVSSLTVIDNLGRTRTTMHQMNLQPTAQPGGSIRITQGSGRS